MTYNVCWKNDGVYNGEQVGQSVKDDDNNEVGVIYCVEKDFVYAQVTEDFYMKMFPNKPISFEISLQKG